MNLDLTGKKSLVFGASSGLGLAIAGKLAEEGAKVAISSRNQTKLENASNTIKAEISVVSDLTNPGSAEGAIKEVLKIWDNIDVLVMNTGGPPAGAFTEITSEIWLTQFQNLWLSAVEGIKAVLPKMKEKKWGRIIFITSVAAKEPISGLTISNGLRAGLLGLVKQLAIEVAPFQITVNSILPGYTKTERIIDLKVDEKTISKQIPAGRFGKPEETAALAAFLASERSSYITGQMIAVDGGFLRGY